MTGEMRGYAGPGRSIQVRALVAHHGVSGGADHDGCHHCSVTERERLIEVVQRLMDGSYASDEEVDSLVAEFKAGVLDPAATDLIFWSSNHFDHEPTAAEVVERALSYRPFEL